MRRVAKTPQVRPDDVAPGGRTPGSISLRELAKVRGRSLSARARSAALWPAQWPGKLTLGRDWTKLCLRQPLITAIDSLTDLLQCCSAPSSSGEAAGWWLKAPQPLEAQTLARAPDA